MYWEMDLVKKYQNFFVVWMVYVIFAITNNFRYASIRRM